MRFIIVRPEVQAFSQAMEQVLAENSWMDETDQYLLERLKDEVKELEQAIEAYEQGERNHEAIMKEACDVGNFAMMVFDRHFQFLQQHWLRRKAIIETFSTESPETFRSWRCLSSGFPSRNS